VLICANGWAVNLLSNENAERRASAFWVIIGQADSVLTWSLNTPPLILKLSLWQFIICCPLHIPRLDYPLPLLRLNLSSRNFAENFEYCLCLGGQYIIFPELLSFALQATASVLPEDPGVLKVRGCGKVSVRP
jgi:hypothetical protein